MNKYSKTWLIIYLIACALLVSLLVLKNNQQCLASSNYFSEPQTIRCTCYIDTGYTYSGQYVRHGIVAGKEEWQGMVACLWRMNEDGTIGDFLGYYEVLDTGGASWLNNGTAIDIWCDGMEEVRQWQKNNGDYVYMQLVKGVG